MRNYYPLKTYDSKERFLSYHAQKELILECDPKTVLNIGCGNKFLTKYFIDSIIEITNADSYKHLKPDIYLDLSKSISINTKYDCVCAFQILEHLPIENLFMALSNLYALSNKWVLISVPYRCIDFRFFDIECSWSSEVQEGIIGEKHYWELGTKLMHVWEFKRKLEKFFVIEKAFALKGFKYHYFFKCRKRFLWN